MDVAELDFSIGENPRQCWLERGRLVRNHAVERIADLLQYAEQALECHLIFGEIQDARGNIMRDEINAEYERNLLGQPLHLHVDAVNTHDPAEAGAILFGDVLILRKRCEFAFQALRDGARGEIMALGDPAERISRDESDPERWRLLAPVD